MNNCCYFCHFSHPKTGFDLVNEDQIFIELKSNWKTDTHNSKESKFHHLEKYITQMQKSIIFA